MTLEKSALFSSVIGIVVGALQGYFGGRIDLIGQRLIEVWSGMPALFLLILLSSVIQPGFWWDQAHPAESHGDQQQPPETRLDHAGEENQQKQRRHAGPDFNQPLPNQVNPAGSMARAFLCCSD